MFRNIFKKIPRERLPVFFIAILVVLTIISYSIYRRQIFSKEVLKLEILGPEKVEAGKEIEYTVKYKNNGNVRLEDLSFIFEYPEGTLFSEEQSERITMNLEDIYPGQEEIIKFKAQLFGQKGDIKTVNAFLSYRPKNLSAFYESESKFSTIIEEVPLTFGLDFPSKVFSGKETKISVNYFSNLDYPLSNLRIKIDYPQGFEFVSSKPDGIEKNEWAIPILNKAEGGRVEVLGRIAGQIGGQQIFKAQLGVWLKDEFFLLKETQRGVEIIRPHLSIDQRINGFSDYIASPGELLRYEIFFRNIGDEPFEDLFLVVRMQGPFDLESINSEYGRVNSADSSILWDEKEIPELRYLAPGEEGEVEFWVSSKKDWEVRTPINKNFSLRTEISLFQAKEEFQAKLNSRLEISQTGYFRDEVFGNSGPIPPKVGQTTTYTIIWQVKNYYNDVKNAKARASLPPGVKLTGKIFPEEEKEKFTFDSVSREILWNLGDLEAGTGTLTPQKSIAFQISFEPSNNHKGLVATLINEASVSGDDQWTEMNLSKTASAVDTTLPDDNTVSADQGIVQE